MLKERFDSIAVEELSVAELPIVTAQHAALAGRMRKQKLCYWTPKHPC